MRPTDDLLAELVHPDLERIGRHAAGLDHERLGLAHVIRLAAGPLIFLGGCLIGWRLGRAR